MDLNSRRKKLLEISNYIEKQRELIKLLDVPGYYKFVGVTETREKNIKILTDEDIDNLIQSFKRSIKTFEKKDIKKSKILSDQRVTNFIII